MLPFVMMTKHNMYLIINLHREFFMLPQMTVCVSKKTWRITGPNCYPQQHSTLNIRILTLTPTLCAHTLTHTLSHTHVHTHITYHTLTHHESITHSHTPRTYHTLTLTTLTLHIMTEKSPRNVWLLKRDHPLHQKPPSRGDVFVKTHPSLRHPLYSQYQPPLKWQKDNQLPGWGRSWRVTRQHFFCPQRTTSSNSDLSKESTSWRSKMMTDFSTKISFLEGVRESHTNVCGIWIVEVQWLT